jgi:diguanylate cyclase (GGDEF)-like protein
MSLLQAMCNQTITVIIMITSFFSAIFFIIIFALNKSKGILMIFFSNVFQIAITASLLALAKTNNEWALVTANILSVVIVVFWINAVFMAFDIKISYLSLVTINALGTIQALVLYTVFKDIHVVNVLTVFVVAAVAFYGAIKAYIKKKRNKSTRLNYSIIMLFVFGLLNIVRGTYRLLNPLDFSEFNMIDKSAALFILLCYVFSFIINYSILYLDYSELVYKVEKLSYIDKLTGALSRNTFYMMLGQKLTEVKRGMRSICVALLDIDNFKRINDTYGHLVGDEVLKSFIKTIKNNMRGNDIIGRYGGEEFILIMEAKSCEDAVRALGRIKEQIKCASFITGEKITFSCGHMFIDRRKSELPVDHIIKEIDTKMYEAKALGKDRVV